MSSSSFNRPGAIDPSAPTQRAQRAQQRPRPPGRPGSYVIEVTEQTLRPRRSAGPEAPGGGRALLAARRHRTAALRRPADIANASDGKFLLAWIVDTAPGIVQARSAGRADGDRLIGGQAAPLFRGAAQGPGPGGDHQPLKAAVVNGVVGRAEPVGES